MTTVQQELGDILDAFRNEYSEVEQTVQLLGAYFRTLSAQGQTEFFAALWSHYSSERIGAQRAAHAIIVRVWSAFGPTDNLVSKVFSCVDWNDPDIAGAWAINVGGQFIDSLWKDRLRFSKSALDSIKERCVILADFRSPPPLVELAKRIDNGIEKIKLEQRDSRYRKKARHTHVSRDRRMATLGTTRAHPLPTKRRAATVARLIGELNTLKPEMNTEQDYNRLSTRFP